MFSPQRKASWTPLPSGQRNEPKTPNMGSMTSPSRLNAAAKGKAVVFIDGLALPPPPLDSLPEGGGRRTIDVSGYGDGNTDDWRRFKEAGLLDEASMERKDREALLEKISRLEKELFDYQYNMGLLLLEKKDLTSTCDELSQEAAETQAIIKREQTAHLIAMSEAEKRVENLKRALDLEKKCVVDLERSFHELREEHDLVKVTAEKNMIEADARMAEVEEKQRDLEGRSHLVDAKLAEADRKLSGLERKLQDLKARENILQKERLSFDTERETHETTFRIQKKELLDLERKLQEREERLCEDRRNLDEMEYKVKESESTYEQKMIKLEQLQKEIDLANGKLKKMEDAMSRRSTDLLSKEEKVETMKTNLEMREKQVLELEERLIAKERVGIQEILDEHRASLSAKRKEFELDIEQRRCSLEKEMENKLHLIKQKEDDVNHEEMKVQKREQALEQRTARIKEKEKDIDTKAKELKDKEKYIKSEEKRLEAEKNQIAAEAKRLLNLKDEIEKTSSDIRSIELQIHEEKEQLIITEEQRSEHIRMKLNLQQEMENWRQHKALVLKEAEDLKRDRENFEKDWETLDKKRALLDSDLQSLKAEQASFEKFRCLEVERLKKEKSDVESSMKQKLEAIRLENETFIATMKHEREVLAENARIEHSQMLQELEQKRIELAKDMQKNQEELEKKVLEKERLFEVNRARATRDISVLKEDVLRQKEELDTERQQLERDKCLGLEKKQLEEDQREIHKDIEMLSALQRKLDDQRKQLAHERARFFAFTEKLKGCRKCGELVAEVVPSDHQSPIMKDEGPLVDENSMSVGHRKSLEGGKRKEISILSEGCIIRKHDACVEDASASALLPSQNEKQASVDRQSNVQEEPEESQHSNLQGRQHNYGRKGKSKINRTRSVKAVVEDAKAFLGESLQELGQNKDEEPESLHISEESHEKSSYAGKAAGTRASKRSRAQTFSATEQDVDVSEGQADSVTVSGRRKRQQTDSAADSLGTPGTRRYNLRRNKTVLMLTWTCINACSIEQNLQTIIQWNTSHNIAVTTSSAQTLADKNKDDNTNVTTSKGRKSSKTTIPKRDPGKSIDVPDGNVRKTRQSTARSSQLSYDKTVKFESTVKIVAFDSAKIAEEDTLMSEEAKSAENTLASEEIKSVDYPVTSEEVNCTLENVEQEDADECIQYEDEDNDDGSDDEDDGSDDDGDESDHPGEVSVGKLLWKFFTT